MSTSNRTHPISEFGQAGLADRMPYFFRVLEDLLGLKAQESTSAAGSPPA